MQTMITEKDFTFKELEKEIFRYICVSGQWTLSGIGCCSQRRKEEADNNGRLLKQSRIQTRVQHKYNTNTCGS